jgi:hypothetical protein
VTAPEPVARAALHVGKNRKIVLDQADIRMRNDAALGIDNVGDAVIADLGRPHNVLDQREIISATLTPASRRVPATDSVM